VIGQQLGRWVGIKAIFYSIDSGRSVMLEQWIDENSNNNWHRVFRYTDSAYWGGGFPNSGGSDNQVITCGTTNCNIQLE
jgi:hypothetical protein